jgi:hypothetical protein
MKDSIAWSKAILRSTPQRWLEMFEAFPRELLTLVPLEKEWSAVECLIHMIDNEKFVFAVRLNIFAEGKDAFPAFPDDEGTKIDPASSLIDLAREFAQLREANLNLIDQMTPDMFPREARHSTLGRVTLAQLISEVAAHDLDHTIQAERAMMQTFIEDCGPWHIYFESNKMKK